MNQQSTISSPADSDGVGESRKPRRRWFLRFNLRLMILVVTCLSAWLAWHVHRTQKQREAVKAILELGGSIGYDFQFVNGKPTLKNPSIDANSDGV